MLKNTLPLLILDTGRRVSDFERPCKYGNSLLRSRVAVGD
jgi:hypothetical protein